MDLLRNWYLGISNSVRLDGEEGDRLPTTLGLRQGCARSPSLFNVYMDVMMSKVPGEAAGRVMVGSERVVYLDLADEVALLADLWLVLVTMVMRIKRVAQRFGISKVHGRVKHCLSGEVNEMSEWKTCSREGIT